MGYSYAGLRPLVDIVGPSFAKEILFTARRFTASEALRMGLVNQVLPREEIGGFVDDYARTIAANAPLTVKACKTVVAELAKDPAGRDVALCEEVVGSLLRERGLQGRADRVHGEAQAPVHGALRAAARTAVRDRERVRRSSHRSLRGVRSGDGPAHVRRPWRLSRRLMFALVVDDALYLKADEQSRTTFESCGLPRFEYARKGKRVSLSYYLAPGDALEDPLTLAEWARPAFDAALRGNRAPRR